MTPDSSATAAVRRKRRIRSVTIGSVIVLVLVIAAVTIGVGIMRNAAGDAPEKLHVELIARAEGEFSVTYTEPLEQGAATTSTTQVNTTDTFGFEFTGQNSDIRFQASISQSNIGPQQIICEIKINDEIVLQRQGDQRYVDCSANLQDLYREHMKSGETE
jgi:hypothetical protein